MSNRDRIRNKLKMIRFCQTHKISYEDMYRICEGDFETWYIAYEAYIRFEMRHRIETGDVRPIDIEDVWGGSQWVTQ